MSEFMALRACCRKRHLACSHAPNWQKSESQWSQLFAPCGPYLKGHSITTEHRMPGTERSAALSVALS